MVQLTDIQEQVQELSEEERESLMAFLLHRMSGLPSGPSDEEVAKREAELDSGAVSPISQEEFLKQVGRRSR